MKKSFAWVTAGSLAFVLAAGTGGCGGRNGSDEDGEADDPGTDALTDVPVGDGVEVDGDGGPWVCYITSCNGHLLECGDCEDNDSDGSVDSRDPECLGPCDNTEGPALASNVGGETGGPCRADCYFDFGNGPGNDDCHWDHRCDPLAVPPDYPPEGIDCAFDEDLVGGTDCPESQSTTCIDFCMDITPNGCDCFGCCTFPELDGLGPDGGPGFVLIGAMDDDNNGTCTLDALLDPALCPPCTHVADCVNDCGPCELCLGRTELPPECSPEDRCEEGVQPCGLADDEPCPAGYYCTTGCCIQTMI